MRHGIAIRFAVMGDIRFLSHRDMLRLFERAVARASVPIRYSEGFNPRPRLRLPLPRNVSVASDEELLVVELEHAESPDSVLRQLAREMPEGVVLREAFELPPSAKPQPVEVTYHLDLAEPPGDELGQAVHRLMEADRLEVRRALKKGRRTRIIDLRALIVRIDLSNDVLTVTLRISPEGSARPAEVLELLGLDPTETLPRLRRVAVLWEGATPEQAIQPASE